MYDQSCHNYLCVNCTKSVVNSIMKLTALLPITRSYMSIPADATAMEAQVMAAARAETVKPVQ